jgi:uncharacterized protein YdhG (YjbR/CyaY superfamily)
VAKNISVHLYEPEIFIYLNYKIKANLIVMATDRVQQKTIDEFISSFPAETQAILEKVRSTIKKAAPDAKETINYGIPTFTFHGNLVHFSAFKSHIGFYPTPSGIEAFRKELSSYEHAKGSVKFPIDEPIPYDLITEIVKFRVKENAAKSKTR